MNEEVLNPMCTLLALLCTRSPLKAFVLNKINEKIEDLENFTPPVLTIMNKIGGEAIQSLFLPKPDRFLRKIDEMQAPNITMVIVCLIFMFFVKYFFFRNFLIF